MGLDMYAYAKNSNGEEESLADWRKHNRLHGFMEDLWESKGRPYEGDLNDLDSSGMGEFNCVPVELEFSDLEDLFESVTNKTMPETGGFFFGDDSFDWTDDDGNKPKEGDYYYKKTDLQFIEDARKAIQKASQGLYLGGDRRW